MKLTGKFEFFGQINVSGVLRYPVVALNEGMTVVVGQAVVSVVQRGTANVGWVFQADFEPFMAEGVNVEGCILSPETIRDATGGLFLNNLYARAGRLSMNGEYGRQGWLIRRADVMTGAGDPLYGFAEFHADVMSTLKLSGDRERDLFHMAFGLGEEAGEVLGKFKRYMRDDRPKAEELDCPGFPSPERVAEIRKECGDVLWYLDALAHMLGTDLRTLALEVSAKLRDRKARGVLGGSGDNR